MGVEKDGMMKQYQWEEGIEHESWKVIESKNRREIKRKWKLSEVEGK